MDRLENDSPLEDGYSTIKERVRSRGRILMVVAAAVVMVVTVRGLTLWSTLPGEVPVRWSNTGPGFHWSSNNPFHWVDKTVFTVFGQLLLGVIWLGVGWALIRTGLLRVSSVRIRRFLIGRSGQGEEAFEALAHDDVVAWVSSGISVAMALDSWDGWSLALGQRSPGGHALSTVVSLVMLLGVALSIGVTWLQLRRLPLER